MGVTGLWRLVEPAGKPVPVETLENKVLAVDISIWLHQVVKGYQDAKGAPLPNAHLLGLFQRLCKLLYFRIKPVFVFDGAFPELKKETIAKRQDHKAKYNSESERIKRELAVLLSKKTAIGSLLGQKVSPKKQSVAQSNNIDDIFKLPALPQKEIESESESESEEDSSGSVTDLHSVDIESENFKKLPVQEKYELLVELKETRKMNSWGKLHELPKKSDNFSDYQMQRLLKRRKVQECFHETEKEMGQNGMSLNDLERLLNEEGIDTKLDELPTRRIASDNKTRFLFIQNVKQTLADMKRKKEMQVVDKTEDKTEDKKPEEAIVKDENETHCPDDEELQKAIQMSLECSTEAILEDSKPVSSTIASEGKIDELEEDLEKAIKMSLECTDHNTTASTSKTDDSWTSFLSDSEDYNDSDDEDDFETHDFSSAKAYIMQFTDFTHKAINKIVADKKTNKTKSKIPSPDQIIKELQQNNSVIVDNIVLSSDDENLRQNNIISQNNEIEIQSPNATTSSDSKELFSPIFNDETCPKDESVACVENAPNVIIVDSSTENDISISGCEESNKKLQESGSSDDEDFEDVLDSEQPKTVVELNLEIGDQQPEDDIFADVFAGKSDPKNKTTVDVNATNNTRDDDVQKPLIEKNEKCNFVNNNREYLTIPLSAGETKNAINAVEGATISINKMFEKAKSPIITLPKETEKNNIETKTVSTHSLSSKELNTMVDEIEIAEQDLVQEKGRLDRIGRNITEQMTKEAQELLQIFGIPYIVAPMEAEAQCAFLENANLTDGTITDDSDIWLFGGRNVYKNFFNQKKNVMQYLAERIEKSYNLSREQLILLALLVGSDYTTGLSGVGPVTALEILASFPINRSKLTKEETAQGRYAQIITGLQEFKQWLRAGRRTDNISLKRKLRSVKVTDDFPSMRVVQAYMEPRVDKSEEKFSWGKLDITILRDYAKAKFGWSQHKLDEIIKPVLKRIEDRKSQKSVQDYFKKKIDFQSLEDHMSKRVKAAVQKMGPDALDTEAVADHVKEKSKPVTKRKAKDKSKNNPDTQSEAGPSRIKKKKMEKTNNHNLNIVSQLQDTTSKLEMKIPKTDRFQEIIPQKEKDIQKFMQNKMKAIEVFRKTNIDKKRKVVKKRANLPKANADLSESSDSN